MLCQTWILTWDVVGRVSCGQTLRCTHVKKRLAQD